jgi:hypothetical protein
LWNIAVSANPIGLIILAVIAFIAVIVLLVKHHKEIGEWIGKAWDWIWEKIKWVWQKIQDGAAYVRDYVVERFMTLINFFTSLPGKMRQVALNLFDGVKDSFRNALNWIIGKWNNFSLTVGGGTFMGMQLPSVTLNTPNLPYLDVGGRILETGMAVVHRGEEVVPAAEVGRRQSSSGGGGVSRLIIGSDGTEDGRYLVERLRKAVRSMGGDFDIVFES